MGSMALGIILAACILLSVIPEARPLDFRRVHYYMFKTPSGPVNAGDSVSIECGGQFYMSRRIGWGEFDSGQFDRGQWISVPISMYRNGQEIEAGLSGLTFIARKEDNQAKYVCRASHFRKHVTITVYFKPDFVVVSSGKTSPRAGEKDRFTCIAPGGNPVPILRIYLKRSGGTPVEVIQGQDRVMVKADNQAEYYCEAMVPGYPALDVTSPRKIYRVTFPFTKVSFTNNPTATVNAGQVKRFTCKTDESNLDGVTNTTLDQYVYGLSWRLISTGHASPGRSGVYGGKIMVANFYLTATKAMHRSVVRCQFLGKDGHGQTMVSTTTSMYVKWSATELKMVGKPHGPVDAGVVIPIKCETDSSNSRTPGPILWYRNGRQILRGARATTRPASDSGSISVSELTFTVRKEDNQANYECKINDQASFRQDVNITVHFKPSKIVMIHKQLRAIHEGQLIMVACETDSANPPADIQFYRRRGTNRERLTKGIATDDRAAEYSGTIRRITLAVTANRSDNQAVFECQVREGSFHLERQTTVTVYYKPDSVIVSAGKISSRPGEKERFTCRAIGGNPAPTLRIYFKRSGSAPVEVSQGQDRVMAKADNQAEYYCEAKVPGYPAWGVTSPKEIYNVTWSATELKMVGKFNGPVDAGVVQTIRCETDSSNSGFPGPILWYREGQRVTTGINASTRAASDGGSISVSELTFTVRKEDNQANYECKINDQASFRQDANVTVHFKPSKLVMNHKPLRAIREASSITITCETDSASPAADIQFYRRRGTKRERMTTGIISVERAAEYNGKIRTSTLTVTATRSDNQAVFECLVREGSFHLGQAATVTVYYKPDSVIVSSGKTSSRPGEKDMFTCSATGGNPVPILRIYFKRSGGTPVEVSQGQDRVMAKADNQAVYYCEAKVPGYPAFSVTSPKKIYNVTWSVTKLAMVDKPHGPVDAGVNETIKCETDTSNSGFPGPILWYRNGRQIRPVGMTASHRATSDGGSISVSELTFTVRKEDNQANYECKINDQASFRQDVNITVHFKPSALVMIHKPRTAINEGKLLVISCATDSSNPAAHIQFYRRRGTNRERLTKGITSGNRPAGYGKIQTTTLAVTADRSDNQAVFECQVQEGLFHLEDATTVTVYYKAKPMPGQSFSVAGKVDDPMKMTLRILANPPPTNVTWFHPNHTVVGDNFIQSEQNDTTYTLSTTAVRIQDFGSYGVDVRNAVGTSSFVFELKPRGPPHKPCCLTVKVTPTEVTLTFKGHFNGGSPQSFTIERRSPGGRWTVAASSIADPGQDRDVVHNITGLESNQMYEFRVKAVNGDGDSGYGQTLQIKTPATDLALSGEDSAATAESSPLGAIGGAAVAVATMLIVVVIVVVMLRRRNQACFSGRHQPEAATPGDGVGNDDLARPADAVVNDPIYMNNTNGGFEGDDIPVEQVYVNDPRRKIEQDMSDEEDLFDYDEIRNTYYADLNITPEVIAAKTYADLRQGTSTQPRRY